MHCFSFLRPRSSSITLLLKSVLIHKGHNKMEGGIITIKIWFLSSLKKAPHHGPDDHLNLKSVLPGKLCKLWMALVKKYSSLLIKTYVQNVGAIFQ